MPACRRHRGSGVRRIAPLPGAARRGDEVVAVDNLLDRAAPTNVADLVGSSRFTLVEHDVSDRASRSTARSTRCCTSRARRARRSTSPTRS